MPDQRFFGGAILSIEKGERDLTIYEVIFPFRQLSQPRSLEYRKAVVMGIGMFGARR